jgi:hypothetical protein
MTAPPATLEPPLYVSDDELPRLVGVDKETLGLALRTLDRNPKSGFPKPDPMFGNKRYFPKVKEWFAEYNRTSRPQQSPPVIIRERQSA